MRRVGVIVARFQNSDIHIGHAMLVNYVKEISDFMIIVLGESKARFTTNNPLPFEVRKIMFEQSFKTSFKYKVVKLVDCKYNDIWSRNLDKII